MEATRALNPELLSSAAPHLFEVPRESVSVDEATEWAIDYEAGLRLIKMDAEADAEDEQRVGLAAILDFEPSKLNPVTAPQASELLSVELGQIFRKLEQKIEEQREITGRLDVLTVSDSHQLIRIERDLNGNVDYIDLSRLLEGFETRLESFERKYVKGENEAYFQPLFVTEESDVIPPQQLNELRTLIMSSSIYDHYFVADPPPLHR